MPKADAPLQPNLLALVDDDPAVLHSLTFMLETAGYAVEAFADAESALAASRQGQQQQWKCMVLDQKLPGMSGLDLLERLRATGFVAPAVLITTHPSRDTAARATRARVEILEKPLLEDQVTDRVRALMPAC